jgi:putative DeoR family transcriptional regulator (stage III sporulation protein D)
MKTLQIVTTAHKDVTDRLALVNPALAKEARKVLDINKAERHIRGGMATKEKYRCNQSSQGRIR